MFSLALLTWGKQTEVVTLSAGGNRRALWPSALRGWPRAAHHEGKVAYRLCLRLRWRGRAPFLRDGVPHLAGVARRLGHCQDWRNGAGRFFREFKLKI